MVHPEVKIRFERIGGSRVDTEPTVWGLDAQVYNLLWTGEEAMKKSMQNSKKAGFESVEDLPRTAVGFSLKAFQDLPDCHHSSGRLQGRMVSKESECLCPMRTDSTASPNFLCRNT